MPRSSDPNSKTFRRVTRQFVIDSGVDYLREAGVDSVCRVCIMNGGSCCSGCPHLVEGVGCSQRNTSCTAWLCGFLKLLLVEADMLREWNDFWDDVPGQQFRYDITPDQVVVRRFLSSRPVRPLGEALAADLDELARKHNGRFIIDLREKLDKEIDRLQLVAEHTSNYSKIRRKIRMLSAPFHHFHAALAEHRST